jgi:pyruvate kinase
MRRTKIVATVGPASSDPAILERLIRAGADVVRLNFSHGDHAGHLAVIEAVRGIAAREDRSVALLQDLPGPKIRTGRVEGGAVQLAGGSRIEITTDEDVVGNPRLISTSYAALPQDVSPGDAILLDDGNLELKVLASSGDRVECQVVHGGPLRSNKGMNLPAVSLSTPTLTERDREHLAFGIEHGVDFVALSFVRRASDIEECKALVRELGGTAHVIAKIEKREAVDDLEAILDAADGVMVARGDLGVELSTEEVPPIQKRIIFKANQAGRVVITATQMLESMVSHPRPTRAEASDVANAILDGTDGVMLSAETAVGSFPVEAVETMARIAGHTESQCPPPPTPHLSGDHFAATPRSLARVASTVAEELDCRLIVAFTESGTTARLLSSYRPKAPIAALTLADPTYHRLALWWGVLPLRSQLASSTDDMIAKGEALLKQRGLVRPGDTVLMLVGQKQTAGVTNMLRVHTVA